MPELESAILQKLQIIDLNAFIVNLILAVIIFLAGIILGKLVKFIVKKAIEGTDVEKSVRWSFIQLFLTSIKWAIYILFFDLALIQLGIAGFTSWISSILVIFPALVGAIILIGIGFAIAVYLKVIIKESQIESWQILSDILFYFVIYIFLVFSIKTALISQDKNTVNLIIILFTTVVSVSVAYWHVKKPKIKSKKINL